VPNVLTKEQASNGGKKSVQVRRKLRELSWEDRQRLRIRKQIAQLDFELENATTTKDKLYLAQTLAKLYQPAGLANAGNYRPETPRRGSHKPIEPQEA
jgi:hypothetical protein